VYASGVGATPSVIEEIAIAREKIARLGRQNDALESALVASATHARRAARTPYREPAASAREETELEELQSIVTSLLIERAILVAMREQRRRSAPGTRGAIARACAVIALPLALFGVTRNFGLLVFGGAMTGMGAGFTRLVRDIPPRGRR
jgi:hypothetical protein